MKELLKAANEKVRNPDVIVDPYDMTYIWASERFCRILGYPESEVIGKQLIDLTQIKKDEARRIEMEIIGLDSGKPMAVPLKRKDGRTIELKGRIYHIDFRGQPYVVAKILG